MAAFRLRESVGLEMLVLPLGAALLGVVSAIRAAPSLGAWPFGGILGAAATTRINRSRRCGRRLPVGSGARVGRGPTAFSLRR